MQCRLRRRRSRIRARTHLMQRRLRLRRGGQTRHRARLRFGGTGDAAGGLRQNRGGRPHHVRCAGLSAGKIGLRRIGRFRRRQRVEVRQSVGSVRRRARARRYFRAAHVGALAHDYFVRVRIIGISAVAGLGEHQRQRIFLGIDWFVELGQLGSGSFRVIGIREVLLYSGESLRRRVSLAFLLQRNSELVQRVRRYGSLRIFLQQLGKSRFRRAEVRAFVIVVADDHLVAREHLAADQYLVVRQLGEVAFGKALLQFLEALERRLGLALILVFAPNLIVVTQPDVVGDELEIFTRWMHPLEIIQRADRLRVILLLVVGEADFHLGVFGVRTERVLVDHQLIIFDRGLVLFCRKIKLALGVVVFAGGLLAQTASGCRQQSKSHQYQQQSFHRVTQKG